MRNGLGGVPLLYAAMYGHLSSCKILLEHGADPNIADTRGGTILHFAASSGSGRVVKLLLSYGAQIDAKDFNGKTPLDVPTVETAEVLRRDDCKSRKALKKVRSDLGSWQHSIRFN